MGTMRSFKGGALAVLVLLSACVTSDAAAAGSLGAGGASSPGRARRVAHRRMLAADYNAPTKRVLGDYADADVDAALWDAALSPPPPSPRTPSQPSWPPPPRRSPPPAPAKPTEARQANANGVIDVRDATPVFAAATNGGGGGGASGTAPPRQSRDAFAFADALDGSRRSSPPPPAPLSRAEFMAKMEAEWNAIGEDDDEDRDASSDDANADDAAVSSPAAALATRDADADAKKEAKKTAANEREASEKAAVERTDSETTAVDDAVRETDRASLSRSVGVDARERELPGDSDATGRNARGVLTGGFAAIAALAFVGFVSRALLRSIENARPHSSIELGSSSFKRASSSGVPIEVARLERGGGDGDTKRAASWAASKREKERSRSGPTAGPPGAPPGLDLGRGGATALFGDSGPGRRGKKNSRKTTREEDEFYS